LAKKRVGRCESERVESAKGDVGPPARAKKKRFLPSLPGGRKKA